MAQQGRRCAVKFAAKSGAQSGAQSGAKSGLLHCNILVAAALVLGACNRTQPAAAPPAPPSGPTVTIDQIPGHDTVAQDNAQKEEPRLVPAEAYIRTYLSLFGYLYPGDLQQREFPANYNKLFDTWQQYTAA